MNPTLIHILLPQIILAVMAMCVLLVGVYVPRLKTLTHYLAQAAIVLALACVYVFRPHVAVTFLNGQLVWEPLSYVLSLAILLSVFFVFVYSKDYTKVRNIPLPEFYALALLSVFGMLVLVSSNNWLTLFLAMELFSLPIYAMVAIQREYGAGIEAAMKYFIYGAFASAVFLYGVSLLFGATGHLNITQLAIALMSGSSANTPMLLMGLIFTLTGICFKLGSAPFHMWVPDVYDGSPTQITLFISSAPKLAAFALLIKLLVLSLPSLAFEWHEALVVIAILSMALGNILAIAQDNIKRLLAYSSIAHMGYILLAFSTATPQGEEAALFYMLAYLIMTLGAFGVLVLMSGEGIDVEKLEDLAGLNSRNPWLAFLMLLLMFSMAGVPPIVGFIAKLRILEALMQQHAFGLAIVALLFAIIGAYYYLRVVMTMYFEPSAGDKKHTCSPFQSVAIGFNGLLVLVVGIYPAPLFMVCQWVLAQH